MLDHKAIEKVYEAAEFWGCPMEWASEYIEKNIEQFEKRPEPNTTFIYLLNDI